MSQTSKTLSHYKAQHAVVTWGGIILNLAFAIPMFLAPAAGLDLLGIPHPPLVWARMGALALIFITIFYIPMTLDIDRFRIFAWLSIFPVRFCGAFFFITAVVIWGAPTPRTSNAINAFRRNRQKRRLMCQPALLQYPVPM